MSKKHFYYFFYFYFLLFQFPVIIYSSERIPLKTSPQSLVSGCLANPWLQPPRNKPEEISLRRWKPRDYGFLTLNLQVQHSQFQCIAILQNKDISGYKPYAFQVNHNCSFILFMSLVNYFQKTLFSVFT